MKKIILLALVFLLPISVSAFEQNQLVGTWCFYEQEAAGNKVKEQVTIILKKDGTYKWNDVFWKQKGQWSVAENRLKMSDVGSHKLISVSSDKVEMSRGSTMRMKKGACK